MRTCEEQNFIRSHLSSTGVILLELSVPGPYRVPSFPQLAWLHQRWIELNFELSWVEVI